MAHHALYGVNRKGTNRKGSARKWTRPDGAQPARGTAMSRGYSPQHKVSRGLTGWQRTRRTARCAMASRWMAPKLAKLHRPYTDDQLMLMDGPKPPKPEVLDAIADEKFWQGWDRNKSRAGVCGTCQQIPSANGDCGCALYVPAPPRTLPERRYERKLAVAVDMQRERQARGKRKRRMTAQDRERERKLAMMGLR